MVGVDQVTVHLAHRRIPTRKVTRQTTSVDAQPSVGQSSEPVGLHRRIAIGCHQPSPPTTPYTYTARPAAMPSSALRPSAITRSASAIACLGVAVVDVGTPIHDRSIPAALDARFISSAQGPAT